jgi:hypothetical protein
MCEASAGDSFDIQEIEVNRQFSSRYASGHFRIVKTSRDVHTLKPSRCVISRQRPRGRWLNVRLVDVAVEVTPLIWSQGPIVFEHYGAEQGINIPPATSPGP